MKLVTIFSLISLFTTNLLAVEQSDYTRIAEAAKHIQNPHLFDQRAKLCVCDNDNRVGLVTIKADTDLGGDIFRASCKVVRRERPNNEGFTSEIGECYKFSVIN